MKRFPSGFSPCQATGCLADLTAEGEGSLRVKVCLAHRRVSEVDIDGVASRYCQQCTKFHPLSEFDGKKRGCRRRLEGHNLRRKQKTAAAKHQTNTTKRDQAGPDEQQNLDLPVAFSLASNQEQGTGEQPGSDADTERRWSDPVRTTMIRRESHQISEHSREDRFISSTLHQGWEQVLPDDPVGSSSMGAGVSGSKPDTAPLAHEYAGGNGLGGFGFESDSALAPPLLVGASLGSLGTSKLFQALELELFHLDMKIAGITPTSLPPDLAAQLLSYMEVLPLGTEGTIRPGCVHLSVDFNMGSPEAMSTAMQSFLDNLWRSVPSAAAAPRHFPWMQHDTILLLPHAVAQIRNQGQSVHVMPRPEGPVIHGIYPIAISGVTATMKVSNLRDEDTTVLCRVQGRQHELVVTLMEETEERGIWAVEFMVPPLGAGFAWIEVMQDTADGMLLSKPHAMLLTDWAEVAEEVASVGYNRQGLQQKQVDCLLKDFGECLHNAEDPHLSVYASSIVRAARLGFPNSLELLGDEILRRRLPLEEVMRLADRFPGGNLTSQAVQSGDLETLQQVVLLAEEADHDILAEVVDPESRMCALHWAAAARSPDMVLHLLESSSGAAAAWLSLPGGLNNLTPFQMFGDDHATHFVEEHGLHKYLPRDVLPVSKHAPLRQRTPVIEDMDREAHVYCSAATTCPLVFVGSTAIISVLMACPIKCAFLSLAVLAALLATCRHGWHLYCSILGRARGLAETHGVELSWFLAPLDPVVEAQYSRFVLSRMSKLQHYLQASLPMLLTLMALRNSAMFQGPQFGWSSLAIAAVCGCVTVPVRLALVKRGAVRAMEWYNVLVDVLASCAFIASFAVPLLKGRQPDLHYPLSVITFPIYVSIPYHAAISGTQAYGCPSPIQMMVPFRLVNCILFIIQGYLASLFSEPGASLKGRWATLLICVIISSGLYCSIRLRNELASINAFLEKQAKREKMS